MWPSIFLPIALLSVSSCNADADNIPIRTISLPRYPPSTASIPPKNLISLSYEFKHFPKYAGTPSTPNTFSLNLLRNLYHATGVWPVARVGGNSGDDAIFNASQLAAEVDLPIPPGYTRAPASIGASFFESYRVWKGAAFITQLNVARNDSIGVESVKAFTKLACKALGRRLWMWEVGNEPDQFATNWSRRPGNWTIGEYIGQWRDYAELVQREVVRHCPALKERGRSTFFAPSFAGVGTDPNSFTPVAAFEQGIADDG
jgi:hypothetical protein